MYPVFHSLAEWQDVNIGSTYKTPDSAWLFTHFIAKSQRQIFLSSLSSNPFFSFLVDGSTDSGNIEQELVFVLYSYKDDTAKEIRSCTRYLSVVSPTSSDTLGLVDCLGKALSEQLGISLEDKGSILGTECRPVLIGGASDGASVNIGIHSSLKAHLQSKYPWLFWAWCFSHRLELACKDACISSLFSDISEMLLRLYYLYHQSPKKISSCQPLLWTQGGIHQREEVCQYDAMEVAGSLISIMPCSEFWMAMEGMWLTF